MSREDKDVDTSYDLDKSKHKDSIRQDALKLMHAFFYDKSYWAGGAIPKTKLYRDEHIKAVMEMNVMDAFAIAYYLLDKNPPDGVDTESDEWDIELCYEALKQIKQTTPKSNQGGMLLVYLSICYGIDFVPTLQKLHEIRAIIAQWEKEEEEWAAKEDEEEVEVDDDDDDEEEESLDDDEED